MNTAFRPALGAAVIAACTLATASFAASADTLTNFSNPAPITIGADPSTPYPSPIAVTGLRGNVVAVNVTLNNVSHAFPQDIDVLLVGPQGQQVILMADAGAGTDVSNLTLTLSASATATLPTPLVSGTWLPTDREDGDGNDVFPAPAPAGVRGTDLRVFNGPASTQNGGWRLFVRDDYPIADAGSFASGWTLSITTAFASCADEGFTGNKLTLCRRVCEVDNSPSTLTSLIKLYTAIYREAPPCAL